MSEPCFPVKPILEKCAEFLEQAVLPGLNEPLLIQKTYLTSVALRILANTVEEKGRDLIDENNGMREVLGRVLEALQRKDTLSQVEVRSELIEKLAVTLKGAGAPGASLSEENARLKGALVDTVRGLDTLSNVLPQETVSSLRRQIRAAIRQQLDHGLAHIEGVPVAF
ncbi:MAG: hypothetical protein FJ012_02065 [Chloroflexi bacterium]|nr:hypothetical protein [Chloroflexota bacterium]